MGVKPPAETAPADSGGGEGDGGREGLEDGLPTRVAMTDQRQPASEHREEIPAGTWRGWIGRGRPREVTFMGRTAAFHDGGGICSPGRWPPGKRRLPTMGQEAVLDGVLGIMRADLANSMGIDVDRFMMKVVTGNVEKPPFQ